MYGEKLMTQTPTGTNVSWQPSDEEARRAAGILADMDANPDTVTTIGSLEDLEALLSGQEPGEVNVVIEEITVTTIERPSAVSLLAEAAGQAFPVDQAFEEIALDEEVDRALETEGNLDALEQSLKVDEIAEFEAALKLFDDKTLNTVMVEEALGIDGAGDIEDVFAYGDLLEEYTAALAKGPFDVAEAEADLDTVVGESPLSNPRAVDVSLATTRLEILEYALANLNKAYAEGRVSFEYLIAAEEEARVLIKEFGHEAELETIAQGADVVVVDFSNSNKPEPQL
jgi:hypothetical protein